MQLVKGDLFDYPGEAIGHGVNCQGLMGAGIAQAFRAKYPMMYESYHLHCLQKSLTPGEVFIYKAPDGKIIVNIASQNLPGADAKYSWLSSGLLNAAAELADLGIPQLAIPKIGCGIGGLDWDGVYTILTLIEMSAEIGQIPFEFVVYSPEGK